MSYTVDVGKSQETFKDGGAYAFQVTSAKPKTTSGGHRKILASLRVIEGDLMGESLFLDLWLKHKSNPAQSKAWERESVQKIIAILGFVPDPFELPSNDKDTSNVLDLLTGSAFEGVVKFKPSSDPAKYADRFEVVKILQSIEPDSITAPAFVNEEEAPTADDIL